MEVNAGPPVAASGRGSLISKHRAVEVAGETLDSRGGSSYDDGCLRIPEVRMGTLPSYLHEAAPGSELIRRRSASAKASPKEDAGIAEGNGFGLPSTIRERGRGDVSHGEST